MLDNCFIVCYYKYKDKERKVDKMTYTTLFIITGLLFTLVAGTFFGMIFYANSRMKNGTTKIIVTIILAFVIGFGIGGFFTLNDMAESKIYNDGVHIDCGGHWELFDIERTKSSTNFYYYQCDECDYVVRFEQQFY